VPDRPEAWLLAVARNRAIDQMRRQRVHDEYAAMFTLAAEHAEAAATATDEFPDERLTLLFLCADPAIDPAVHTPLMLQTVLGIDAATIASAFLISPAAMSQRLVRAKRRIAEAGIPFDIPRPEDWPARLTAVLEAVYAAYADGWLDPEGADPQRAALAEEGVWLGRVLASQLPQEPEALGLLALMLHLEARRPARRVNGAFAPLEEQDVRLWRGDMIAEAEALLGAAGRMGRMGRFQLEAAIQSAHAARRVRKDPDWDAIVTLYDGLLGHSPSPVVALNRAAAIARRDGAAAGFAALEALEAPRSGATSPIGRCAPICWRGSIARRRRAGPMTRPSRASAIPPSSASSPNGAKRRARNNGALATPASRVDAPRREAIVSAEGRGHGGCLDQL
jgi:RNA polymerase sigma-70 factor (ECF subfamily)